MRLIKLPTTETKSGYFLIYVNEIDKVYAHDEGAKIMLDKKHYVLTTATKEEVYQLVRKITGYDLVLGY